jgi:predicted ester cyclase
MSIDENKAFVRRFIDEVLNLANIESLADYCVPGSFLSGGLAGQVRVMKMAFPDNRFAIDEMVAEGDKVVVRMTINGTNTGPLAGLPGIGQLERPVPPTGKPVSGTAIYIFTIGDGKIVSLTSEMDLIGMLKQMGWAVTLPD